MGEGFWCDMCGLGLPTPNAQIPIEVGKELLGSVCINCSSQLKNSFKVKRVAIDQQKRQAQAAYEKAQKEAAQQEAQQAAQGTKTVDPQPIQPPPAEPPITSPPEIPPQAKVEKPK